MDASTRLSKLVIVGLSAAAAAAIVILTDQPDLDSASIALGTGSVPLVPLSALCQQADRTAVTQLATFLERNGPADAPVLERAIHALNIARRHCLYEWDGRGLEDYEWLNRWVNDHS
jgi:hypothetical protein